MRDLILQTSFFGVLLSVLTYFIGLWIKRKFRHPLLNPLLIAMVLTVTCLVIFKVDYESYMASARYLSVLLTPATVCLAIPLYEQLHMLKANPAAIMLGVVAGVLSGLGCILLLSIVFGLTHVEYVTLLPKCNRHGALRGIGRHSLHYYGGHHHNGHHGKCVRGGHT